MISEDEFYGKRYDCPLWDYNYSKCSIMINPCDRNRCPIIYWIEVNTKTEQIQYKSSSASSEQRVK